MGIGVGRILLTVLLLAALAAGVLGIVGAGGDRERGEDPPVVIEGLYPDFDPGVGDYVSRCGRGAAPIRARAGAGASVAVGAGRARSGTVILGAGVGPGEDFRIAVTDDGRGRVHRVRCLPRDFPAWRFEAVRPVARDLLFTVAFRASRDARPWVIVFDGEGVPRWWYTPRTRALWAQVLSDGSIAWARSFGDGYGLDPRMAHEVRSPAGKLLRLVRTKDSIVDGHELRELSGGRLLIDSYTPGRANLRRFGGPARAAVVSAKIEELDPAGRVRWRWSSRRHIGLEETGRWWRNVLSNAKRVLRSLPTFDPVHINSIEPRGEDEIVISMRHTDAVYGIDRATGEIAWKLGGTETPESLRVLGDPAHKLLGGQHDARIAADGTLSVYDNAKDRPRRPRVVFYRLEPEAGKATYTGQLNDPRVKSSHCCGSARQLADGGWLVSWGDNPIVTAFDREGRIAFRLGLPVSTFRAVPVPPGATSRGELDRGLEEMERR
jgi:hypothetical protein